MYVKRKVNGVSYLSENILSDFSGGIYIKVRDKEGRLYSDEELKHLPDIRPDHPLRKEWDIRKRTGKHLVKYFSQYENKNILEVGCGNGWLSNLLGRETNNKITALDMNKPELIQGAEVFKENENVSFVYGNIFENIFPPQTFDYILLAGSIQYFTDFDELINQLFYYSSANGEIHIADTNFYTEDEAGSAKLRTKDYFESLNLPEMIPFYHHRKWDELKNYNFRIMNKTRVKAAGAVKSITGSGMNIFPWIIVQK